MGTYIDVASVRRTCGIKVSEINDDDVDATIIEIEQEVPRIFNTVFTPTQKIEFWRGDGSGRALLQKNPILAVRELKIEGTTEDVANLEIDKQPGYIFLGQTATQSRFSLKENQNVVKYIYGTMQESNTNTISSDDEVAGTDVSIAVDSITDFEDEDWVEIYGMDGQREAAQINTAPVGGVIQVDQLVQSHEAGSTIVKLQVDPNFTKLMNLIASIALVARIVGQSYTDTVGYDLGELHVQKGEPYTQWRETANQFIKERDFLMSKIGIRPYIL